GRRLAGPLTGQLGVAATSQAGTPPRWLPLGLGAYLGARVEPRSPYYRKLRAEAVQQKQLDWNGKVTEVLTDQADAARQRAIGFSLLEWLGSESPPAMFAAFVREMLKGQGGFDELIKEGWGVEREKFIEAWGEFVALNYGR